MEVMPYVWFGVAVLMAVFEAITYQLVSIWFVLGAVVSAVAAIFIPGNIVVQIIIFVAVSLITLIVTRPLIKKMTLTKKTPTNSDRYIGKTGVVKSEINNQLGVGQVIINGSVWSAKSDNSQVIPQGTPVTVKEIKGVKLIVTPAQ